MRFGALVFQVQYLGCWFVLSFSVSLPYSGTQVEGRVVHKEYQTVDDPNRAGHVSDREQAHVGRRCFV